MDPSDIYGTKAQGAQFYRRSGARLTEPQDKSVVNLSGGETPPDLHEGFHAFDKAHAVMLAEQGFMPADVACQILDAFREMEAAGVVDVRTDSGHSAHAGEAYLIDELGEDVGGHIHLARSSHDLAATAVRIAMRERLLDLMEASLDLMEAYATKAEEYLDAMVPTYTGIQHAQVATVGFCLMGFERSIERDFERLLELYERTNTSPAGTAVGTTSDFPVDRHRVADLLGFDGVLDNAEDVDKSFDLALEAGTSLATQMADLGRAADTLLMWYSPEFSLVDMPDRFCGTSSIMPQKKNPHTIQSVQRDTNGVIGEVMDLFVGAKNIGGGAGVPLGAFETTTNSVKTWAALVEALTFDEEMGEQRVYLDWALATDLAGALVREADVPWRTAHQIVSILVRRMVNESVDVTEITADHVEDVACDYLGEPLGINDDTVTEALDARQAVEARADVPGSPAPEQVDDQIAATREFVSASREEVAECRNSLAAADQRLEHAVDALRE